MYVCVLPDFNLKKVYEIVQVSLLMKTLCSRVAEVDADGVQGSRAQEDRGILIGCPPCLSARSPPFLSTPDLLMPPSCADSHWMMYHLLLHIIFFQFIYPHSFIHCCLFVYLFICYSLSTFFVFLKMEMDSFLII